MPCSPAATWQVFPDYATAPPPIGDLQQFYKEAKNVFDQNEAFKKLAHEEVVRLQGGDGGSRAAWEQICNVSRREFEKAQNGPLPHPIGVSAHSYIFGTCSQVYSRLDVRLTEVGESFYNEYIPPVVAHLEEIGLAKLSDGAKAPSPAAAAAAADFLDAPSALLSCWPGDLPAQLEARAASDCHQVRRRILVRLDRHGRGVVQTLRAQS